MRYIYAQAWSSIEGHGASCNELRCSFLYGIFEYIAHVHQINACVTLVLVGYFRAIIAALASLGSIALLLYTTEYASQHGGRRARMSRQAGDVNS